MFADKTQWEQMMDFDKAIQAHMNWKLRLRTFFDSKGTSEEFDVDKVCKDNLCDLGKWIYAEGSALKSDQSYEELRKLHADFHKHTADIIKTIKNGNANIESLIGGDSNFGKMSLKIVTLVRRLKTAAEKKSA